ncbi:MULTISPECIES: alpha/beta hydrolase [unclassified Paenibacillus]|uniref:alpha/beta hydrolase n=1 Tax=unclassified Paenibacillus TaxID=185978 RepID=UPI001141720B|nr:alpha/beta hydrolase [Paenibacillus sp. tmac-D7]
MIPDDPTVKGTIQKTLMTCLLFEGFWDRWIAHGIRREDVAGFQRRLTSAEAWNGILQKCAEDFAKQAIFLQAQQDRKEAEEHFRMAGLYYNLLQWLYPTGDEKRKWFARCKELFQRADRLSEDQILEAVIDVDGNDCFGRIRVPERKQGIMVIVNPIDSSKEELFTYETDFAKLGFVTVSFDGPGQGETYVRTSFKATRLHWEKFMNQVIDYASNQYPGLPLALFGTSSGGAWAIEGSAHPKVGKAISVSPACASGVRMPDYFMERMAYILDDSAQSLLPKLDNFDNFSPILLFHGNKDVMVKDTDIYELYQKLPAGKQLIEYENEGHCCNFKLREIRKISAEWSLGG